MQWTDLTIQERNSQKKRFNILASMGHEDIDEQLDEIEAEIDSLDERVTRLEGFVRFTVTLTLKEDYDDITVKFDNVEIEAGEDGKYTINNVVLGMHSVEAHADGYGGYYERKFFSPEDCELEIELLVGTFDVFIQTEPAATDDMVFKWDGVTKTRIDDHFAIPGVEAGLHEIDIAMPGYYPFNQTMGFTPTFNTYTATLTEDPRFTVTLDLAEDYEDITVSFDGNEIEATGDEYIINNVQPGKHTVEATCPDYADLSEEVTFSRQQNTYTITLTPTKPRFNVTLLVTPSIGAVPDVSFDGKDVPETDLPGLYNVPNVKEGVHTVYVNKPGYEEYLEDVRFTEQSKQLTITLEPDEPFDVTITPTPAPSAAMQLRFDGRQQTYVGNKYTIADVNEGYHNVDIDCQGYISYHNRIHFTSVSNNLEIELVEDEPFTANLVINPSSGAVPLVKFDEVEIEPTAIPGIYDIPNVTTGLHHVYVEKEDYETYDEHVRFTSEDDKLSINLVPEDPQEITTVTLDLAAAYENPHVYFDGDEVTPTGSDYIIENVLEGPHVVRATADHCQTFEEEITFNNEYTTYTITLEPLDEGLTVSITTNTPAERTTLRFDGSRIEPVNDVWIIYDVDPGLHSVAIDCTGYESFFARPLVSADNVDFEYELQTSPFTVFVNTTPAPSNAMSFKWDGETISPTGNKYIIDNVDVGFHNIRVAQEGYATYYDTVEVTPLENELSVNLGPELLTVTIDAHPVTSNTLKVKFDGSVITGHDGTYVIEDVQPGEHHVKVSQVGYETYEQDVEFSEDFTQLDVLLRDVAPFDVTIFTQPTASAWMTLEFDGDVITVGDNKFVIRNVANGEHTVKVTKTNYKTYEEVIEFTPTKNTANIVLERDDS